MNILHNRREISIKGRGSLCFQLLKELMDTKENKKQTCNFDVREEHVFYLSEGVGIFSEVPARNTCHVRAKFLC